MKTTGTKERGEVKAEGSCTRDEHDEVAEAMRVAADSSTVALKKARPAKGKVPDTPEQKELKELQGKRKDQLAKVKALFSKGRREVADATNMVGQIKSKGYPATFSDHLQKQVNAVKDEVEGVASNYASEVINEEAKTSSDVQACIAKLVSTYDSLDSALNAARKGSFADCKKLGGSK